MPELQYEVWLDDNSGARIAAFRYLDDARAFAHPIGGLVFDTRQQADVTCYPREPGHLGGHELRPAWLREREAKPRK